MGAREWLILWGSPVGLAVFFAGVGVLLWGVSRLKLAETAQGELELKQKQYLHERKKEAGGSPTP